MSPWTGRKWEATFQEVIPWGAVRRDHQMTVMVYTAHAEPRGEYTADDMARLLVDQARSAMGDRRIICTALRYESHTTRIGDGS